MQIFHWFSFPIKSIVIEIPQCVHFLIQILFYELTYPKLQFWLNFSQMIEPSQIYFFWYEIGGVPINIDSKIIFFFKFKSNS